MRRFKIAAILLVAIAPYAFSDFSREEKVVINKMIGTWQPVGAIPVIDGEVSLENVMNSAAVTHFDTKQRGTFFDGAPFIWTVEDVSPERDTLIFHVVSATMEYVGVVQFITDTLALHVAILGRGDLVVSSCFFKKD